MIVSMSEARSYIGAGLEKNLGYFDLEAAQAVGGVSILETSNTNGWKGVGKGSFNAGAITAGRSWKGDTFEYRDSRPHPKNPGKDIVYVTKFRKYATPQAGFEDLVRVVLLTNGRDQAVLPAAEAGDFYGVSAGLFATRYYLGLAADPTPAARIARHYGALYRAIVRLATQLGDVPPMNQLPLGPPKKPEPNIPLLLRGSGYAANDNVRDLVRHLQRDLGLVADGLYGKVTARAVRAFQKAHKLRPVDGKVGPDTRRALGWAA